MSRGRAPLARSLVSPTAASIAALGRLVADPRRVAILEMLRAGPATVTELALSLGLRASEASTQLSRLKAAHRVRVVARGRHRIYSADPDSLTHLLDRLAEAAAGADPRLLEGPIGADRRKRAAPPLRGARSCYDHLAGIAGVELVAAMERAGWVVRGSHDFVLTRTGERQLLHRGVDLRACREARRMLAPGCLDWTERRLHLGGSLGAAILTQLLDAGYLRRTRGRPLRIVRPVGGWVRAASVAASG